MQRHPVRWLLPAMLALAAAAAGAADAPTSPPQPSADPLDAKAAVPAVTYRSGLAAHRRLGEAEPVPWREANDRVGRIGGWRAYAREANAPEPAGQTTPAPKSAAEAASMPMSKPMPGSHGGHKMH